MSAPAIAVVAALPEELAPLRARLTGRRRLPLDAATGAETLAGQIAGRAVALVVTGDGARNAAAGLAALLERVDVERLLLIGVAGALTGDLAPQALTVAAQVRDEAAAFDAEAAAVQAAVDHCGARPVTLVTATRIAGDPGARADLLRAHGDPSPAVVDLESAVWVRAAQARRLPWLAMRAIIDTADQTLPPLLERAREEGGATNRGQVLRGLMFEPTVIPTLVSLRWRLARCAQVLAAATERLLGADARGSSAA